MWEQDEGMREACRGLRSRLASGDCVCQEVVKAALHNNDNKVAQKESWREQGGMSKAGKRTDFFGFSLNLLSRFCNRPNYRIWPDFTFFWHTENKCNRMCRCTSCMMAERLSFTRQTGSRVPSSDQRVLQINVTSSQKTLTSLAPTTSSSLSILSRFNSTTHLKKTHTHTADFTKPQQQPHSQPLFSSEIMRQKSKRRNWPERRWADSSECVLLSTTCFWLRHRGMSQALAGPERECVPESERAPTFKVKQIQ